MYCIGWKPRANCTKEVDLGTGTATTCPPIGWFWFGAAAVAAYALVKRKR